MTPTAISADAAGRRLDHVQIRATDRRLDVTELAV
jgi:hypothetical protein